ncbi:MAG: hypothetical protein RR609_09015, partial [Aurantimicrobium sp.]
MVAMIAPRRRFGLPPALDINSLDAESLIGLSINAVPVGAALMRYAGIRWSETTFKLSEE